jgi:hypothetical protein
MRTVLTVALVLASSAVAGVMATNASTRAARNPVATADWKIWKAKDTALVRLNHDQISPQFAKCATLKRAGSIGVCEAAPLQQQARGVAVFASALGKIALRTRPGQCRVAMVRYEFALQAAVSSAVVSNKELILANKALWKSSLALEKQVKDSLGASRAAATKLCRP